MGAQFFQSPFGMGVGDIISKWMNLPARGQTSLPPPIKTPATGGTPTGLPPSNVLGQIVGTHGPMQRR